MVGYHGMQVGANPNTKKQRGPAHRRPPYVNHPILNLTDFSGA